MHNQPVITIKDPVKFMNGLMYFTKIFKQTDRKYFMITNNRLFTVTPYSVYPDPTDYFNAELDITIPYYAAVGNIQSGFITDEKKSNDLNDFIRLWYDTGLMYNLNSITRIMIDVDAYYNMYKSLKDEKKFNIIEKIEISSSTNDYIGYDKITIYGLGDCIMFESSKLGMENLTTKVPRIMKFEPNGQVTLDLYGEEYMYLSQINIPQDIETQIYFGDKPVDAVIDGNVFLTTPINWLDKPIKNKRFFISKNMVPKEFSKCVGIPLVANLYKFVNDNKTFIIRLSKLVMNKMIISSDFKTIFV